jgi:hypothetical protein
VASGLLYKIKDLEIGLIVYADDTTVVCESFFNLRGVINIIETFCSDYDININTKKTKWMRLTPNYIYILNEETVKLGGVTLEKVHDFKFLGVIICSDNTYNKHYKKRKSLYMEGISEIITLGFNKSDISARLKNLLYTSLARSKLVYGLETIKFTKKDQETLLSKLENNQIKRANNLSYHSKSKTLLYAMNISPIEVYLLKRKISFIIQLTNNETASDLLARGFIILWKMSLAILVLTI